MAQLKPVSQILTEYHIEAEAARRAWDEKLERDPVLAPLNEAIRNLGVQKLERAMNGQSSELIDARMEALEARSSARIAALESSRYMCDLCRDTGIRQNQYCTCLRARIYQQHYGAYDPLAWPLTLSEYDLSVFDDTRTVNDFNDTQRSIAGIALNVAREIASGAETDGKVRGLFLHGVPGVGKTWLVRALARQAAQNGIDTAFIHAVPLFDAYHRERLGASVEMHHIEDAQLLIIDDLGAEPLTANVTTVALLRLLTHRSEHSLQTVITTNQNDIRARYAERISSRLHGSEFTDILMNGNDLRYPASD